MGRRCQGHTCLRGPSPRISIWIVSRPASPYISPSFFPWDKSSAQTKARPSAADATAANAAHSSGLGVVQASPCYQDGVPQEARLVYPNWLGSITRRSSATGRSLLHVRGSTHKACSHHRSEGRLSIVAHHADHLVPYAGVQHERGITRKPTLHSECSNLSSGCNADVHHAHLRSLCEMWPAEGHECGRRSGEYTQSHHAQSREGRHFFCGQLGPGS